MKKKNIKALDIIILIILAALVIAMATFTVTRQTSNQEIILMEIYKSAGPDTSTLLANHYYIYENTNTVGIRTSNYDEAAGNSSNTVAKKDIEQDLIDSFKKSLEEYISENPSINTSFYINERYTIEYNGSSIIVPNPTVAGLLGFDPNEYTFYNTVESFINSITN